MTASISGTRTHAAEVGGKVSFRGVREDLVTGSPAISPEGLVLSYDMKTRTARGGIKDFSGRGNDGQIVGTETAEGPFGTAVAFRRATDYVGLPFGRSLHLRGPVSIAVWARFAQLRTHQHLLSYDDLYTLWIDEGDRIRFSDTRGNALECDPGVVSTGRWTPLVATFSGRRGDALNAMNIAVYVGGSPVPGRAVGRWNPGSPVEGYVGKEAHEGQFYIPFLGEIAAVLVFRRALSHREAEAFSTVPRFHSGGDGSAGEASYEVVTAGPPAVGRTDAGGEEGPPRARIRVPPRVVRITSILPPYRMPTLELLQSSPAVRFEQWIMASSERNRRWDSPVSSGRVRTFRDWGIDLSHRDMITAHFNPGMLWELSSHRPDLVILGGYEQPTCLSVGLLLARLGIPFLLSSESISLQDSLVGRQAPALVRKLVRRAAGVIVPGEACRSHFLELEVPPERIFVAPNAIHIDRFRPAASPQEKRAVRKTLGLPEGIVCLYVGRLTPTKGIMDLLEAFAGLRPGERKLHLVVVGDGLLREAVESKVAGEPALTGHVSLPGYAPEELLPAYYMASDVFVFPTRRDIWGLVLNEAMCAGLPVVASDGAAATLDLLEDGETGIRVPAGRPVELRAAIERLVGDADLRQRLGTRARERILSGFTPNEQAGGFLRAISTTLRRVGARELDVATAEVVS